MNNASPPGFYIFHFPTSPNFSGNTGIKLRNIMWQLALLAIAVSGVSAQVHMTREEALRQYFPGLAVERKTIFLTEEQAGQIRMRGRAKVDSRLVTYYVGRGPGGVSGYAFFETEVVRTMPETYMVVVNPDSTVRAVEILAFYEPEDYLPPRRWLDFFREQSLKGDLWLKRGIPPIVGATLSAQSLTDGVRRILAIYEIAVPKEK